MLCGAAPSSLPTPSLSPSASPSPNQVNFRTLLKEFVNAQRTEIRAIYHRYKFELQELKASQDARFEDWMKKEKDARHKFCGEHPGPECGAYVRDFVKRRDAFRKLLKEERFKRKQEQDVHTTSLKQDQASKLKDFKQALDKGASPSPDLWPQPGH